jgi:hypothetical protein
MSCDSAACEDYGPQRGDRGAGEPQKERVPDLGAGTGCWNWLPDRAGQGRRDDQEGQQRRQLSGRTPVAGAV